MKILKRLFEASDSAASIASSAASASAAAASVVAAAAILSAGITPTKVTITYEDFQNADTPGTFPIATSAGGVIDVLKAKHSISFEAPLASKIEIDISSPSEVTYIPGALLNVFAAVGDTVGVDCVKAPANVNVILNQVAPDAFNVILTVTDDVIANMTAGSLDIWYTETICI